MKIVVVGGTGRLGSAVVKDLADRGHEAVAAAPNTGFNAVTGEGVAETLAGADVVVDVSNSPSFEDGPVMEFFTTSTTALLAAEAKAGVRHHVVLSIVGADRAPDSGYLRAKVAQEALVTAGAVPFSVIRATQFFEFVPMIVDGATQDGVVRLTGATLQPIAARDLAAAVADVAEGDPLGSVVEVAGPQAIPLAELGRRWLETRHDPRTVTVDDDAAYFGERIDDQTLTPNGPARLGPTDFATWLAGQAA